MNNVIRRIWHRARSVLRGPGEPDGADRGEHGAPDGAGRTAETDEIDGSADRSTEADGAGGGELRSERGDDSMADLSPAEFLVEMGVTRSEYVLHLLRQHDGKLSQSDICDELGWSKATTSRKLKALEEEGRIVRRRIGRKNVVLLSGPKPDVPGVDVDGHEGGATVNEA